MDNQTNTSESSNQANKRSYPRYFDTAEETQERGERSEGALEFRFQPKHSKVDKTQLFQSPTFWSESTVKTVSSNTLVRTYTDQYGQKLLIRRLSGKRNATTFELPIQLADIFAERLQEIISRVKITAGGQQYLSSFSEKPEYEDFFKDSWWGVPVTAKIVDLFLRPYTSTYDKVCIRIWQRIPEEYHREYQGRIWRGSNSFLTLCTAKALVTAVKQLSEESSSEESQNSYHV